MSCVLLPIMTFMLFALVPGFAGQKPGLFLSLCATVQKAKLGRMFGQNGGTVGEGWVLGSAFCPKAAFYFVAL